MTNTTARIKKGGKHFEILVDLDEAMKVRRKEENSNLSAAVLTEAIFYNLKSGEHASTDDLEINFGTTNFAEITEKIIKEGEIVRTADSMRKNQDKKYKQVVEFLVRNATSPEKRPYTPERIMKALKEARVNIKNKPIEMQIEEIIDKLKKILPININRKEIRLLIPAIHSGKAYGVIKEFMIKENWKDNGDLEVVVRLPSGLVMDFYDKVNGATAGSVMSEEIN